MFAITARSPRRRIVILGAAGNVYDILDVIEALNGVSDRWEVTGTLDDTRPAGSRFLGLAVLGPLEAAASLEDTIFVNAIGSERTHRRKCAIVARTGMGRERFATLVHPLASVSSRAELGGDICIGLGCAIAGDVRIADHCWLGAGCIIGHESKIADGATLAAGVKIAGHVQVGRNTFIGIGACIRPGCVIGDGALVGMGAVVVRDVAPDTVVIGNPARTIERLGARGH